MRVIFLGPQGVGKGTQAALLGAALGIPALSTGEMLRAEVSAGTAFGLEADTLMKRGDLVPDALVLAMLKARIAEPDARKGFILDGFPRTTAQAEGLDATLAEAGSPIDAVALFTAPRDLLVRRLTGRRNCPACGSTYNVETSPPRAQGACDKDGSALVQRADDTLDAINRRLDLYLEQTAPLADYYRGRRLIREVDGTAAIDKVREDLMSALGRPGVGAK